MMTPEQKKALHELVSIHWFRTLFHDQIDQFEEPESSYSSIDYIITATTKQVCYIEFKMLQGNFLHYLKNTFLEDQKQQTFRKLLQYNPKSKLTYMIYTRDGIIFFNIGERIKQKSIELNLYSKRMNAETYGNSNESTSKLISSLSYQPEKYGDKMIIYNTEIRKKLRYFELIFPKQ